MSLRYCVGRSAFCRCRTERRTRCYLQVSDSAYDEVLFAGVRQCVQRSAIWRCQTVRATRCYLQVSDSACSEVLFAGGRQCMQRGAICRCPTVRTTRRRSVRCRDRTTSSPTASTETSTPSASAYPRVSSTPPSSRLARIRIPEGLFDPTIIKVSAHPDTRGSLRPHHHQG